MNIENLFSKEVTVKISIVNIENKKLTKSIFNQLNISLPFDSLFNLKQNVKFLGYINDKGKWIIWSNNEYIYKCELKNIYPMARLNLNRDKIRDLIEIYPSELVKSLYHFMNESSFFEYRDTEISSVLDKKEQYIIIERQEEVREIINELLKRQIIL
ncbi:hypothetical protein NTJ12_002460 [Flavobacterium psychrophilum]|nr:hypothetical protein [Flavobacterium psychrophilum]